MKMEIPLPRNSKREKIFIAQFICIRYNIPSLTVKKPKTSVSGINMSFTEVFLFF